MNNRNNALEFDAVINNTDFKRQIDEIERRIRGLSDNTVQETNKMDLGFKKLAIGIGAAFTLQKAQQFVSDIIRVRGEFQQLDIALTTMLQSKSRANALMSQLVDFAANTPFGLKEVAGATKQLLAYGSSAENITDELRMLGDLASGVSQPIGDLVYLYGTLRTQGRAYAVDIRQFAGRGIPIYQELAKVLKINQDEVQAYVEAGKVGFPQVQQALQNMTAAGSQFGGLMEAQSKSIPGQIERLGDAWDQMLNKIGTSAQPFIEGSIEGLSYLVENYEDVGRILAVLIATYGTYRAALIATSVIEKLIAADAVGARLVRMAVATNTLTTAHRARAVALGIEATAQRALNLVLSANPYVLIATAVVGLTAAIWAYSDSNATAKRVQEEINEENKKAAQIVEDLKSKTDQLVASIRDETETRFEQTRAFNELKKLYPELYGAMALEEFQAKKLADVQKELNGARDATSLETTKKRYEELSDTVQKLREKLEFLNNEHTKGDSNAGIRSAVTQDLQERQNELDKVSAKLKEMQAAATEAAEQERVNNLPVKERIAHYEQLRAELESQIQAIVNTQGETEKVSTAVDLLTGKVNLTTYAVDQTGSSFRSLQSIIDNISLDNLNNRLATVMGNIRSLTGEGVVQNKGFFENQQKIAKEAFENALPDTDAFKQAKKDYEAATASLEKWSLTNKKAGGGKTKKIDTPLPAGSLAEYDRQIQKANDILSKIPSEQTERIQKMHETLLNLTTQRAEAEKKVEFRTWQETLDFKRQQYQQFEQAIEAGYSDSAKKQFASLTAEGGNYIDFLKKQIEPLELSLYNNGNLPDEEFAHLVTLTSELRTAMGETSSMERFTESLDSAKRNAANTADYIAYLREELVKLNNVPENERDGLWYAQSKNLKEQIKGESQQAAEQLKNFLEQVKGSEHQRLAITKKYADLRAAVVEDENTTLIDQAEQKELNDLAYETSEAFKELNKTIVGDGREAIDLWVERVKAALAEAISIYGDDSEEVRKLQNELLQGTQRQEQFNTQQWQSWLSILGQAGNEFAEMEGAMGAIGQLLSGAASNSGALVQNISQAVSKSKTGEGYSSSEKIGAYAQGAGLVVGLVSGIFNARKRRKEKEKAQQLDLLKLQLDYNMAVNEEIRLRTVLSENVYFKNYAGRVEDSIAAATDAVQKYNSALTALMENGKAINDQKNKVDWGAVGSAAGAGASAGATIGGVIGSVLPGIGTVVGAVVGAVAGVIVGGVTALVGMMKKADVFGPLLEQYPDLITANGDLNKAMAETLLASNQLDDQTKVYLQNALEAYEAIEEAQKQITDIVSELTGSLGGELRDALVEAFQDGTSAAEAFANTVEKTLNNALSNLIFSAVFSRAFDSLQKDLEGSLWGSGKSFQEVFAGFMSQSDELTKQFNEAMKAAQDAGKQFGFDLFDPTDAARANGLSGIGQSITEDTGSLLLGQANAMRMTMAVNNELVQDSIFNLIKIESNTRYLISIDERLARMERSSGADYARASGIIY